MFDLEITLGKVRHRSNLEGSRFLALYERLILGDDTLSREEKMHLLKVAVYFLNSKDDKVERLGYRIILRYSNVFQDFEPLHDVALSRDYIPITKFIESKHFVDEVRERFSNLFVEAYQEGFKLAGDQENVYRSVGQIILNEFVRVENNIVVIAPTSYGKSEMIAKKVENSIGSKICIIVPSKALLAQTKKTLLKNETIKASFRKIITHPDMYREEDNSFLAVLTQERLLRLLQQNKELEVDLVLVDEAHNILDNSDRSHLLAQVLLILQNRKRDFVANFFTPFLVDVDSLAIRNHETEITGKPISEFMKVERFYGCDLYEHQFYLYDQFLNRTFNIPGVRRFTSDIDFINSQKSAKNIIYLNRPMSVERFSLALAASRENIEATATINKIVDSISEFIHPSYNLIECIRKGVVFHHGGIPDIVRLYVEEIFSKQAGFEFVVTTSTLLEGVNIPAEKIFVLSPSKGLGHLSAAQFKNLIGRVCRFKEVFDPEHGSLRMLEPEIYLVKGAHAPRDFSPLNFYRTKVNSNIVVEDDIDNPLLENSENTENLQKVLEYLENMEPGSSGLVDVTAPQTDIGRLCFENNVHDFDILANEETLANNLSYFTQVGRGPINSSESLIAAINEIFFTGVELNDKSDNIMRLKNSQVAQNFYSMFIGWRIQGAPYPLMISRFLSYWRRREAGGTDLIFVGSRWGEETRGGGHQKLWIDIRRKNEAERVNLAIAKIKEEQEFIDFNILKYLEILFELQLVDISFFDQVKYGTSNREVICLLKNGFSMELSKLLTTDYAGDVVFNLQLDTVRYEPTLIAQMKTDGINDILVFEAENNI
jgi:hypothetical protein